MSAGESENTEALEELTDEEDAAKDMELMEDILQSIEASKRDDSSSESRPADVLPPAYSNTNKFEKTVVIAVGDMQLASLNRLLEQLNQALEYNQKLQLALVMKEVKLVSLQRRLLSKKTRESEYAVFQKDKEDELKGDIGKFIVRFKAPYFKDYRNFAGYSVVPRGSFPMTAQYFEERAIEWKKPDLKELEKGVRKFLAGWQLGLACTNDSTLESRVSLISKYKAKDSVSLSKLVPPDFDQIVDWCLIASKLGKHHTPYECQKAWEIFLKPTLNRKPWSKAEKRRLKEIALEHNYEDWNTIAEKLGSSRSGYQCFHEFQDLISKIAEGDWSREENEYLIKLVKECSYGEKILWHKVAYYFGTRSLSQIYRKWNLSSVSKKYKSGPFSEYEDHVILTKMLKDDNTVTQNLVARQLNRLSCQIRYRFTQLMSSLTVKFGEWSMEEDKLLLEYVEKYGTKNWAKVAEHIPQRDRIQARHRHRHIRQRMRKYPGLRLEDFHRERRTVYKDRKQATLKYVMNLAGIQELPPPDGNEVIKIKTAVGDLVINPEDLEEDKDSPKKGKNRRKKAQTDGEETSSVTFPHPSTSQQPTAPKVKSQKDKKSTTQTYSDLVLSRDPVVNFYRQFGRFKGYPGLPKLCCDSRPDVRAISKVLGFKPYKHLDTKNAEWVYNMDRHDPYYRDVLEIAENYNSSQGNDDRLERGANLIPPSVSVFEGFYNLLKDIDFKESDLDSFDPNELTDMFNGCDAEMVEAMAKWRDRLKSLFLWPSALSLVDVVPGGNLNAGSNASQAESIGQTCSAPHDDVIDISQIPEDIRLAIVEPQYAEMATVLDDVGSLRLHELEKGDSVVKMPTVNVTNGMRGLLESEDVKPIGELVPCGIEAPIKSETIE